MMKEKYFIHIFIFLILLFNLKNILVHSNKMNYYTATLWVTGIKEDIYIRFLPNFLINLFLKDLLSRRSIFLYLQFIFYLY